MVLRYIDLPYIPDEYQGYMDYFGENSSKKPVILDDGTSVSFPEGWTDQDADKWRKGMRLERPNSYSERTYVH